MAYNANLPADNGFIADGPGELRENFRALKEDKIVNAGKLKGLEPGHASGTIPISDGTLNTGLNADQLDGHDSAYFSANGHVHGAATPTNNGFMSNTDKIKLNGVATGAEVNQNAFAKVKVGSTIVEADQKQDTLELVAGKHVVITPDTVNDKVTVAVKEDFLPLSGGTITGSIKRNMNESYVSGTNNALVQNINQTGFSTTASGYTKNYKVGMDAVHPYNNDNVLLAYSITKDDAVNNVNNVFKWIRWSAATGELIADKFTGTLNGTVNGNAASATKLQTSRRINGVLFNGTGDITITAAANGGTSASCSGNAASATRLQTARRITIKHFTAFFNTNGTVGRTSETGYAAFNGAGDVTVNVGCASGCATTCVSGCANGCLAGCSGSCSNGCSGSCSNSCGGDN